MAKPVAQCDPKFQLTGYLDEQRQSVSPNQAAQPSLARRTFLQTAAVGAAAASTAISRPLHAADVPGVHSGSDIIRVGLVGCGGRGSGAALDAMSTGPDVHIVAVGDLFEDSMTRSRKGLSAQKPEQFKVDDDHAFTGFDAYKKVIDSDIDVVLLASPPYYRPITSNTQSMPVSISLPRSDFIRSAWCTSCHGVKQNCR